MCQNTIMKRFLPQLAASGELQLSFIAMAGGLLMSILGFLLLGSQEDGAVAKIASVLQLAGGAVFSFGLAYISASATARKVQEEKLAIIRRSLRGIHADIQMIAPTLQSADQNLELIEKDILQQVYEVDLLCRSSESTAHRHDSEGIREAASQAISFMEALYENFPELGDTVATELNRKIELMESSLKALEQVAPEKSLRSSTGRRYSRITMICPECDHKTPARISNQKPVPIVKFCVSCESKLQFDPKSQVITTLSKTPATEAKVAYDGLPVMRLQCPSCDYQPEVFWTQGDRTYAVCTKCDVLLFARDTTDKSN